MPTSNDDRAPHQLFGRYLEQLRRADAQDFEEFVTDHPHVADELRLLHQTFRSLGDESDLDDAHFVRELERRPHGVTGAARGWNVDDGETGSIDVRASTQEPPPRAPAGGLNWGSGDLADEFIGEVVGEGSMGTVHRVWDDALRRHLAMKVSRFTDRDASADDANASSRFVARFVEEAQVTAQLDHPGIVPVHQIGVDASGRTYFTMKLVRGETLASILDKLASGEEGWTLVRVVGLLVRVCEAVAYAHAKGVIHRDLKPSNVMIGRYGEVFVMDWGLARVKGRPDTRVIDNTPSDEPETNPALSLRSELESDDPESSPLRTHDGDLLGTPVFMPPEQALGRIDAIDSASDVYSIGAMLYQALTGHAPFLEPGADATFDAVLDRVRRDSPRSVRDSAPHAPKSLAAICERALARTPEDRYATAAQLRRALLEWTEGGGERGWPAALRRGSLRALGPCVDLPLAVLVAALAATAATTWWLAG